MADRQYVPLGTEDAPAAWTLPATLQLALKAAFASFDGTNASGDFLPCLEIVSDSGHTVGRYTGASVTAGGSADVSWFPRVSGGTGGGSGNGIEFDKDNEGGWLEVTTNEPVPLQDYGISLGANDGSDVQIFSAGGQVQISTGGTISVVSGTLISMSASSQVFIANDTTVKLAAGHTFRITNSLNQALFEVRSSDSSVHIRTGQTVQADL